MFFTFHNVSINTIGRLRDGHLKQFALHSTMFLLIQRCSICLSYCYTTLHSTMFLLIHVRKFAVHVVHVSLHSTMFLLIQNSLFRNLLIQSTLHSTMFLLIRNRVTNVTKVFISLHSTMFLLILIQCWNLPKAVPFTFHNVSINTRAPHPHIIQDLFYHFLSTLSFTIFLKQNLHSQ